MELRSQLHAPAYLTPEREHIIMYGIGGWMGPRAIQNILKKNLLFYIYMTVHRSKFLFNKTNRCTNFQNLFCQETLRVSGSSSAHHQEFSTVHIPAPNVQWQTPDDGHRNCPKHVEFLDKINLGICWFY